MKHKQAPAPTVGAKQPDSPQEFLKSGFNAFLQNGELFQMSIQNDYGVIVVKRNENGKTVTCAIGFAMPDYDEDSEDYEDEENEQDEQAAIKKFVRWL